ncbi:MAG: glycoside hydrolase family 3 N-terminal domain-containing protein [Dehalococcoidia bacterium]
MLLLAALFAPLSAGRPSAARAGEPDPAFLDRVIASLTIDERVGQLVMVNFVGDDVSSESEVASLVEDFKVGSVLVTASNGNVVNRDDTAAQLADLTNGLQQRAHEANARLDAGTEYFVPLFIATDNEGDLFPFTNVTHDFTSIPNNMTIGATWKKEHAQTTGEIVGRELSAAGINMLLGPVVDVLDNPRAGGRGDIGIRSFGGNATWVGMLGRAYVRGIHDGSAGRMIAVAKHFPGHGGSDRSTDNEVPTVIKSLPQLRASELAPFAELVRIDDDDPEGAVDAMMVSHIRYRNFLEGGGGSFTPPISLDRAAFNGFMGLPEFASWREDHLVMADSLGVPAVKQWYAREEGQPAFPSRTVVRDALLAGNDLLPLIEFYVDSANRGWSEYQLPVIQDSIIFMREQYASDPEFRRRADDALRHVIAAKMRLYPSLTLESVLVDPVNATAVAGGGEEAMQALAVDALTLMHPSSVEELQARLPRGPVAPDKVLIVECWSDCYPYRVMTQLALQEQLLAMYGAAGNGRLRDEDVGTISFGDLDAWLAAPDDPANASTSTAVGDAQWIIFAISEYVPDARPASAAVRRFLDDTPVDLRNKYLIGLAFNAPYYLDSTEISKLSAYFAVYSKTAPSIEAAFKALFGDAIPGGQPPVNVSGIFYDVGDATQPDAAQQINIAVFGYDASAVPDEGALGLVAGPIVDRNGNPVIDGTTVSFTLAKDDAVPLSASGRTVDGFAGAQLALDGGGSYVASASVAGIVTSPLAITVVGDGGSGPDLDPSPIDDAGGDGISPLVLALAIGVPSGAAIVAAGGAAGVVLMRRRRREGAPDVPSPALAAEPVAEAPRAVLRVEGDTRRVYVKGAEAKPPLSNEQFRLLHYLYERSGKVISREELIAHVWPDDHAEGVSEEALDALVRRVRERIAQAGGERTYIVTLRGQGFRLEI